MTPAEIMAAVGFMIMVFGAIGRFWFQLNNGLEKGRADLAAHKLHIAETYVTKAGMSEQTAQIMKAIDGVGGESSEVDDACECGGVEDDAFAVGTLAVRIEVVAGDGCV